MSVYTEMLKNGQKRVIKLLTAGDGGVGKTTLLYRYVKNTFIEDTSMTIGIQLHTKTFWFDEDEITAQIWDLGGQERFRIVLPGYMPGSHGALLLFDLTSFKSLMNVETTWLPLLRDTIPDLPIILVGSKKDMVNPESPMIDPDSIKEVIENNDFQGYMEVSSKTGENVEKTFRKLVKIISEK